MYNRKIRGPLVEGNKTLDQITKEVIAPIDVSPGTWWYIAFGIASLAAIYGFYAMYITVVKGIGTWGVNNSVAWGWDIVNFIWWIGIG
ncbi:MAG: hydrogenase, partial [Bacteroidetes bacterium]